MVGEKLVGFTVPTSLVERRGGKLLQYLKVKRIHAEIVMEEKMVELLLPKYQASPITSTQLGMRKCRCRGSHIRSPKKVIGVEQSMFSPEFTIHRSCASWTLK